MLLFTITFGGLLLMMGHHSRAESLFYVLVNHPEPSLCQWAKSA